MRWVELTRRAVPRVALLLSLAWIALVIYEVTSRRENMEVFGPGKFYKLETIIQESTIGVLLVALLAWLALRSLPAPRNKGV
jgi:hypothetical protein